jgi:hypothetical protein
VFNQKRQIEKRFFSSFISNQIHFPLLQENGCFRPFLLEARVAAAAISYLAAVSQAEER